jgi:hypothetical protein
MLKQMIHVRVRFCSSREFFFRFYACSAATHQNLPLLLLADNVDVGGEMEIEIHGHSNGQPQIEPGAVLVVLSRRERPDGEEEVRLAQLDALLAIHEGGRRGGHGEMHGDAVQLWPLSVVPSSHRANWRASSSARHGTTQTSPTHRQ